MKKLFFITSAVVINLVLIVTITSQFNRHNLVLSDLAWFDGFDITTLFPISITGMFLAYFGIFSLVVVNRYLIKNRNR